MAPILELIKKNAVPVNVMRSAAKGALPLPAGESLDILVYLTQNPVFGQDARMTLARWDAQSAIEVLSLHAAAPEVLIYFWQEENRRLSLMPTLVENPAIPENSLIELAAQSPQELIRVLLNSPRARASAGVIEALLANEHLLPQQRQELETEKQPPAPPEPGSGSGSETPDPEAEAAHQAFQQEHAGEIAAAGDKPFELTPEEPETGAGKAAAEAPERAEEDGVKEQPAVEADAPQPVTTDMSVAPDSYEAEEQKRLTILQKISRMNVGQRIKLGFIGNKE